MAFLKGIVDGAYTLINHKTKFRYPLAIYGAAGVAGYLWAASNGTFRYGTTYPTALDSDGSALTAASGLNAAMSNLASVACNLSLISDANNTDDLGSDTYSWRTVYIGTSLVFDKTTRNLTITASEPGTSARTVNFGDPGGNDSVVYLAASQTLTNKTLTTPTIAAPSFSSYVVMGGTPQTLSGAGAVNLTTGVTLVVTSGSAALTLANGTEGQIKHIVMKTDGGDATLTPTTATGFSTITFNDVGDTATLMYIDSGWKIIGYYGVTIA